MSVDHVRWRFSRMIGLRLAGKIFFCSFQEIPGLFKYLGHFA